MQELDFIEIIKNSLDDSTFIGDDCAYLKEFDMFITQDTLVEGVHFLKSTTTPYLLGRKAVSVNLSDLAAALATPLYISVSLSLPVLIKESFVSEFYRGINDVCQEYGVKVTGGDLTGGDKIIVSICALGKRNSRFFSSRKNAKKGDIIVVTGEFGSSGAALDAFSSYLYCGETLKQKHLNPTPRIKEAETIAKAIDCDISGTDCSDGLVAALYNIATASKRSVKIDYEKIPVNPALIEYCEINSLTPDDFVKYGGEDYELLMCIPESVYKKLDHGVFKEIGRVMNKDTVPSVIIRKNSEEEILTKAEIEAKLFDHFEKNSLD